MNRSPRLSAWGSKYRDALGEEQASRASKSQGDSAAETLGQVPTLVLMEGRWLSPSLIDWLAENQQDWVSLMQNDWKMDVYGVSLSGIQCDEKHLKSDRLMVQDFVVLSSQAPCQCLEICQQLHWYYTCCLQVAGLGRVRAVISFDDPQKAGSYAVLFSNRLDWSPRSLLSRWLEKHSVSTLYGMTKSAPIQQSLLSAMV